MPLACGWKDPLNPGPFLDHGFRALPACQGNIERPPPSEYLKRMNFDTITHLPEVLRHVADILGADYILMGTEYPFAVGDFDPLKTMEGIPGFAEDECTEIRGDTAAVFFGLE